MRRSDPTRVGPEHLGLTTDLVVLLRALDDPLAGTATLERLISAIPVLQARCVQRASREPVPLGAALARLGTRGLAAVLLALLEDLTIAKADFDDARAARQGRG